MYIMLALLTCTAPRPSLVLPGVRKKWLNGTRLGRGTVISVCFEKLHVLIPMKLYIDMKNKPGKPGTGTRSRTVSGLNLEAFDVQWPKPKNYIHPTPHFRQSRESYMKLQPG